MSKLTIRDLLQYRLDNDLSQQEAAESVGVTQPAWAHWEAGRRKIPAYVGKIIALTDTKK